MKLASIALISNLHVDLFISQKEVPQLLRDAAGEPTTEATGVNIEKGGVVEKQILENEKKCLEKMKKDPPYQNSGTDIVCTTETHYATLVYQQMIFILHQHDFCMTRFVMLGLG